MNEDLKKFSLQRLAEDEKLLEALEEELILLLDNKKPDLTMRNEDLGAVIRAREEAKITIKEGLKKIKATKTISSKVVRETNPGK